MIVVRETTQIVNNPLRNNICHWGISNQRVNLTMKTYQELEKNQLRNREIAAIKESHAQEIEDLNMKSMKINSKITLKIRI